jgi:hypothetical protein
LSPGASSEGSLFAKPSAGNGNDSGRSSREGIAAKIDARLVSLSRNAAAETCLDPST